MLNASSRYKHLLFLTGAGVSLLLFESKTKIFSEMQTYKEALLYLQELWKWGLYFIRITFINSKAVVKLLIIKVVHVAVHVWPPWTVLLPPCMSIFMHVSLSYSFFLFYSVISYFHLNVEHRGTSTRTRPRPIKWWGPTMLLLLQLLGGPLPPHLEIQIIHVISSTHSFASWLALSASSRFFSPTHFAVPSRVGRRILELAHIYKYKHVRRNEDVRDLMNRASG